MCICRVSTRVRDSDHWLAAEDICENLDVKDNEERTEDSGPLVADESLRCVAWGVRCVEGSSRGGIVGRSRLEGGGVSLHLGTEGTYHKRLFRGPSTNNMKK